MLALGQGSAWGWNSATIVGLFLGAAGILAAWVMHQLAHPAPLVELRLLRHRTVLYANLCALTLSAAMYSFLTLVAAYVQTPVSTGYGFGRSASVAGMCLVPFSILSLLASRSGPTLIRRLGPPTVVSIGALLCAAAGALFAMTHHALWQAFATLALMGIGLGYTFAALPALIVFSVPTGQTGSAMGFHQVMRYVGSSIGTALVASVLAGATLAGGVLPTVGTYVAAAWIGVGLCFLAAVVASRLPRSPQAGGAAHPGLSTHRVATTASRAVQAPEISTGQRAARPAVVPDTP
jgi:predicted MFS family arabinose efflux permease